MNPLVDDPTPASANGRSAIERVVAYFAALGVEPETALRLSNTLDQRIASEEDEPGKRTQLMLEAFDRWAEELPDAMGLSEAADRIAFVLATHLGRLLNQHPEALGDTTGLADSIKPLLDARPHGILPGLPRQEMHRQPLGDLPAVLQGEFWSGTYRWVVPVGAGTRRMLRAAGKKTRTDNITGTDTPPAPEGPPAGD